MDKYPSLEGVTLDNQFNLAVYEQGIKGGGVTSTTTSYVQVLGTRCTYSIVVDLVGMASVATTNDVIGINADTDLPAYIGKLPPELAAIDYVSVHCLEGLTTGEPNVGIYLDHDATYVYSSAASGGTEIFDVGGDLADNSVASKVLGNESVLDPTFEYVYLVGTVATNGNTAGTYDAGRLLIEFHGPSKQIFDLVPGA